MQSVRQSAGEYVNQSIWRSIRQSIDHSFAGRSARNSLPDISHSVSYSGIDLPSRSCQNVRNVLINLMGALHEIRQSVQCIGCPVHL